MRKTIICDIDGTIIKHSGGQFTQYGGDIELLPGVKEKFSEWGSKGHSIVLISGRRESDRELTEKQLSSLGIFYDILILGVSGGERILINDLKPNIPHNTASSYNVVRNEGLKNINLNEW
jgi:hydroxymethylpyrimidine pyrophosphatase-like HAD family hydrolase